MTTDLNNKGTIVNFKLDLEDSTITGLSPFEIFNTIRKELGDWPKRIGKSIYITVKHPNDLDEVYHLRNADAFFAWLQGNYMMVDWKAPGSKAIGCISKKEFFEYVCERATKYNSIELLPHYPPIKGVYYQKTPQPGGNTKGLLDKLVDFFNPETEADRDYLKAMMVTIVWGGPGGARPPFVLLGPTDDDLGGRGVGKSTIVDILGKIFQPYIDMSPRLEREEMTKRILNSGNTRLIRIDNIKTKIANDAIESLVTSEYINGQKLYEGTGERPNFYTWILTDNQPEFSGDMSQRVIPIRLARPTYDPNWQRSISKFIEENRWGIVYNCINILRRPIERKLQGHIRFPLWSDEVLSRVTTDDHITTKIQERQASTNDEMMVADEIKEILDNHLGCYEFAGGMSERMKYDPTKNCYRIRQSLAFRWIKEEMPQFRSSRKIVDALLKARPSWLCAPGGSWSDKQGRRRLGAVTDGVATIELGWSGATQAWYIVDDHNYRSKVDDRKPRLAVIKGGSE